MDYPRRWAMKGVAGWLFQRLTGLVLIAGLLLHFSIMHFSGQEQITYAFVLKRISNPYWKAFDLFFPVPQLRQHLRRRSDVEWIVLPFPRRDRLKPQGRGKAVQFQDRRRLIPCRQRVNHPRLPRQMVQDRTDRHITLDIHHHDVLAGAETLEGDRYAQLRGTRGIADRLLRAEVELDQLLNTPVPNDDSLVAELRQSIEQAQEGMRAASGEVEA
jgi:hypothetical protein